MEQQTKHTPGPWHIGPTNDQRVCYENAYQTRRISYFKSQSPQPLKNYEIPN